MLRIQQPAKNEISMVLNRGQKMFPHFPHYVKVKSTLDLLDRKCHRFITLSHSTFM